MVHHLFPNICHTHYPAIAPIVLQTCREFGIPYTVFPTVRGPANLACSYPLVWRLRICLEHGFRATACVHSLLTLQISNCVF